MIYNLNLEFCRLLEIQTFNDIQDDFKKKTKIFRTPYVKG